jgi:hypothetical protein
MNTPEPGGAQDLFMEVLAARYRLGHNFWVFKNSHKRTARKLLELGLISNIETAPVEGIFEASLSEAGIKMYCIETYKPPILEVK